MSTEFDINLVAAEFVKATGDAAFGLVSEKVRGAKNLVRAQFDRTYAAYVRRLLDRHARAKSFFVRLEPIPLYDFFVPLDLQSDRTTLKKPTAKDIGSRSAAAVISGSGGSGKSMMMRHLLLSALLDKAKTPLFIELRSLNGKEQTLEEALLAILLANGLNVDSDYLKLALQRGHFLLLLDGFDELDRGVRRNIALEIQALVEHYPKTWAIISSRPDDVLSGWTGFTTWHIAPLDIDRAVELVDNLVFDEAIKSRFITDLRKDLFSQHESFLSNPLLLSIMLLTYHDTANIPTKLSIFYNQAYESLFQKHDALKGGYQRTRLTSLDIQEFSRVFAAFCIQSFDKREFSFPSSSAIKFLDHAKKLTNLGFNSADYLRDAIQAVCLLVDEGLDITFAHRSFQEYFAAVFIASATPEQKQRLVAHYAGTVGADQVIPLLWELDRYSVERHYVIPSIRKLRRLIKLGAKGRVGVPQFKRYFETMYREFGVSPREHKSKLSAVINDATIYSALSFAYYRYIYSNERMTADWTKRMSNLRNEVVREFGENDRVPTKHILANPNVLNALCAAPGMWGKDVLRELLDLEDRIIQRHIDTQASLDAILAG